MGDSKARAAWFINPIRIDATQVIVANKDQMVCNTLHGNDEANAALIVTAHLLAIAEGLVEADLTNELGRCVLCGDIDHRDDCLVTKATAAIAKVRGEG